MRQKILFVQEGGKNKFEIESLWCTIDGDNFIIDNIPFIAKRISLGDTIKAEYDIDEKAYYFDDFITVSGNTTVRLYFSETSMIERIREELNKFGCEGEIYLKQKILAVNVPSFLDYKPIRKYLEEGEKNKYWAYEESCLSHEY